MNCPCLKMYLFDSSNGNKMRINSLPNLIPYQQLCYTRCMLDKLFLQCHLKLRDVLSFFNKNLRRLRF